MDQQKLFKYLESLTISISPIFCFELKEKGKVVNVINEKGIIFKNKEGLTILDYSPKRKYIREFSVDIKDQEIIVLLREKTGDEYLILEEINRIFSLIGFK